MKLTNLKESPQFLNKTLSLIEEAFNYPAGQSFDVDFAPLVHTSNLGNCHILVKDDEVLGHIGCLPRQLTYIKWAHPVLLLGGIAISSKHRGEGLFDKLFTHCLGHYSNVSIYFLWSDLVDLYGKYNFIPMLAQYAYTQNASEASNYKKVTLRSLNEDDLKAMQDLYRYYPSWQLSRSEADWKIMEEIVSANLYIKRDETNQIVDYFIKDKGADLEGIIYEASLGAQQSDSTKLWKSGTLWSNLKLPAPHDTLFGAVGKIGDRELFSKLISDYTNKLVQILDINEQLVSFQFQNTLYELSHAEFLTGVFGPNAFDELADLPGIRISGLDSI